MCTIRANFFFGRTFDLVSGKSINYACAVKNDTPIMGLSADGICMICHMSPDKRKSGDEVINEKTMRYSNGYSDVRLRKLTGLNATYFTSFCLVFFVQ